MAQCCCGVGRAAATVTCAMPSCGAQWHADCALGRRGATFRCPPCRARCMMPFADVVAVDGCNVLRGGGGVALSLPAAPEELRLVCMPLAAEFGAPSPQPAVAVSWLLPQWPRRGTVIVDGRSEPAPAPRTEFEPEPTLVLPPDARTVVVTAPAAHDGPFAVVALRVVEAAGDPVAHILRGVLARQVVPPLAARRALRQPVAAAAPAPPPRPLRDPVLGGGVRLPARGDGCAHVATFDAATYLTANAGSTPAWRCPVPGCGRAVLPPQLCVDGFLLEAGLALSGARPPRFVAASLAAATCGVELPSPAPRRAAAVAAAVLCADKKGDGVTLRLPLQPAPPPLCRKRRREESCGAECARLLTPSPSPPPPLLRSLSM
jgi:hypothetical protein